MAKLKVAVLFGGISGEHEISCISASAVCRHLDTEKYEVLKIGITKKGRWLLYPGSEEGMTDGSWETCTDAVPAFIAPDATTRGIVLNHDASFDVVKLDMVIPVLHGKGGEDGTIQGLLEMSGIPYVGCGVLASAACMNKASANLIFDASGIPHTPWVAAQQQDMENFDAILANVKASLKFPVYVKPAGGGSSLGVAKVKTEDELRAAMQLAFTHDNTLVIEQEVTGQEVECAVLGNSQPFSTLPGEIVSCNEIYDYEAKYHSDGASKLHLPARLPQQKLEEVQAMAVKAYKALGCEGLSRVDFFVEENTGRVLLNEINTMPGFTDISMYPKLMEKEGISFTELLDRLIALADERAER